MSIDFSRLQPLGWSNHFSVQLSLEQLEAARPARVIGVERSGFLVDPGPGSILTSLTGRLRQELSDHTLPTVGDWVLLAADEPVITDLLERRTLIARRAAGGSTTQPIAANIDRMVVVSGLGAEFNLHRIERYLVVAAQADVPPLVLLTKRDLVGDAEPQLAAVRSRLPPLGAVVAVDALQDPLNERLAPWMEPGATLVVVGSSGVGKSTVVNNLSGGELQRTQPTRRDAKGRHTTSARSLIRLPGGACIIDVPGMREIGLAPTAGGVRRQFGPIEAFARECRFADCSHLQEPGCAVKAAVERGEIDPDEWHHYRKLLAEERHNVAEHERRRRERVFGRVIREFQAIKRKR